MIVLKWPLEWNDEEQVRSLPAGAVIVHVDVDGFRRPCLWTVSQAKEPAMARRFRLVPTGGEFDAAWSYVGTVKVDGQFSDLNAIAVALGSPTMQFWHVLER